MSEDLVDRLQKRAEIRRQISTRKSVQEGKPDRIADLLEEAANEIITLQGQIRALGAKSNRIVDMIDQEVYEKYMNNYDDGTSYYR